MGNNHPNSEMDQPETENFQFHSEFVVETENGLCFNGILVPEEILFNILTYVDPKVLLNLSLVCKRWCNIVKSDILWRTVYKKYSSIKVKKIPWYIYYNFLTTDNFKNLIKNGNGQEGYKHWQIIKNYGDEFKIENPPQGVEPLSVDVPEFYGHTSCFATSYYECFKIQHICLQKKRLLRYILDNFTPHIYVSEWVAGRFDCGCVYKLRCTLHTKEFEIGPEFDNENTLNSVGLEDRVEQWQGGAWKKVELQMKEYPKGVKSIVFAHEGTDTQFWKGHYGSKMAGGVVKLLIESISPKDVIVKEI